MSIFPHDHRMWAVIGIYGGTEDNVLLQAHAGRTRACVLQGLETGDASLLGEECVHAVTNPLGTFTGALQIYGGDFFGIPRSEFDATTAGVSVGPSTSREGEARLPGAPITASMGWDLEWSNRPSPEMHVKEFDASSPQAIATSWSRDEVESVMGWRQRARGSCSSAAAA
jgi:hypothetical protein